MIRLRFAVPWLFALAAVAGVSAFAQSVVSTHSGVLYFFEGSVFVGDKQAEQKFGKFPNIDVGSELRTEDGRAEVLLTPGVLLRIGHDAAIRMLSNQLSDTRVEVLRGSAILEARPEAENTKVTLLYKNWQMRVPQKGVYRIDSEPPHVQVYQGEVEVSPQGKTDVVTVKEGESLPLATVLVTEKSPETESDDFKNWAMTRSQAVSADNAVAAQIVDDPTQIDASSGLPSGYISYFPLGGIPALGLNNPYGLSFWSPYQSALTSLYFPPYMTGLLYSRWPSPVHYYPIYGRPVTFPTGIGYRPRPVGVHPIGVVVPGRTYTTAPPRVYSRPITRPPVVHSFPHR